MALSSLTNVGFITKNIFTDEEVQDQATRQRFWMKKVRKKGGWTGTTITVPIRIGNPQGVSNTFTVAQANAGQSSGRAWIGARVRKYGVATLDAESMEATKDKKGAFMELVETEVDGVIDEFGRRLSSDLYGDGSGSIGRCSNDPVDAGGPIQLLDANDVRFFALGQKIVANPNKTGNVGTMRAGVGTVTAISHQNGTVAYSGTITGITTNDFLYNEGDYDGALKGLAAHLPLVAPVGGDSFFGVDRSADVERLSGWRLNTPAFSVEENALELGTLICRAGGRPDFGLVSSTKFMRVSQSLSSKVEYDGDAKSANYGFEYFTVGLPSGRCRIFSDPDCPDDRLYLLQNDTWALRYLGKGVPHVVTDDGRDRIRINNADGVELRIRYWGNMFCNAPGFNGVAAV